MEAPTTSARVTFQSGSAEFFTLIGVKLPVTSVNDSNGTATVRVDHLGSNREVVLHRQALSTED